MIAGIHHNPPNHIERIDRIWLVISGDEHGEGVCGLQTPTGWIPLVVADERLLPKIRQAAKGLARVGGLGKTVKLIEMSVRRDLETFQPAKG